jgi:hypothetical protein
MSQLASRRDALRAQFEQLTAGLRRPGGGYDVPRERWRGIVAWLFDKLIDVLLAAPRLFWARLTKEEQRVLRDFSKTLGLAPASVVRETPPASRGEIIAIVRKGLGLRP